MQPRGGERGRCGAGVCAVRQEPEQVAAYGAAAQAIAVAAAPTCAADGRDAEVAVSRACLRAVERGRLPSWESRDLVILRRRPRRGQGSCSWNKQHAAQLARTDTAAAEHLPGILNSGLLGEIKWRGAPGANTAVQNSPQSGSRSADVSRASSHGARFGWKPVLLAPIDCRDTHGTCEN